MDFWIIFIFHFCWNFVEMKPGLAVPHDQSNKGFTSCRQAGEVPCPLSKSCSLLLFKNVGFLYTCTINSNKIMCIWCYFYFIFQTYNTGSSQPYGSQECEQSRGLSNHLSSLNFLKSHFGQLFWFWLLIPGHQPWRVSRVRFCFIIMSDNSLGSWFSNA